MILLDTGPIVGLFDPRDAEHARCRKTLSTLKEPLRTTIPVLTEAFHMLEPASVGSDRLREFVIQRGVTVWYLDSDRLFRAFELMERYADHPMDLADASLVTAAEGLRTRKIFTLDRRDFSTYRVRIGHRSYPFEIVAFGP